jgi:membrane-associated protease RseP (regulator of RpoE activity)
LFIFTVTIYVALALIVHELGHLFAARKCDVTASELSLGLGPRLFGFRVSGVQFNLRLIPLGSFVRLDGTTLKSRSAGEQLMVHLAGVMFNLIAGLAMFGTIFGWISLLVAAGNLLPIYQHDGWKCGVLIVRSLLHRNSQPAEWAFTFSGGFLSLLIVIGAIRILL